MIISALHRFHLFRYDMYRRYFEPIFGMYQYFSIQPTEICDVEWSFPCIHWANA